MLYSLVVSYEVFSTFANLVFIFFFHNMKIIIILQIQIFNIILF